jgi:hypothetical protein
MESTARGAQGGGARRVGVGSDHSVWRYARSRSAHPPRYVTVSSVAVTRMEPGKQYSSPCMDTCPYFVLKRVARLTCARRTCYTYGAILALRSAIFATTNGFFLLVSFVGKFLRSAVVRPWPGWAVTGQSAPMVPTQRGGDRCIRPTCRALCWWGGDGAAPGTYRGRIVPTKPVPFVLPPGGWHPPGACPPAAGPRPCRCPDPPPSAVWGAPIA